MKKNLILLVSLAALSGCSFFGGDEVDLSAPAELMDFSAQLELDRAWSHNIGEGSDDIYPVVTPVIDGDRLFVADRGGDITAIDLSDGRRIWRQAFRGTSISAATGASDGLVLVGTDKGEIIALSQNDGAELWRSSVSSEVLAAPATNGDVVVVLSLDGQIHGLDAQDGTERWLVDTTMPLLTVRGNAIPVVVKNFQLANGPRIDVAFVGLDNGKVICIGVEDGVLIWEARVGVPEGQTDLERMVDIDGRPLYHNGVVYAASYQSGLMAIEPANGQPIWYQEGSSNVSPGAYAGTLALTEENGTVRAFNASEGIEFWSTDEYANRALNAPAATSDYIAFADYEGYLHLLSRRTGETIGRQRTDSSGVRSPTIIHNDQIIVLGNSGTLAAYSVSEL